MAREQAELASRLEADGLRAKVNELTAALAVEVPPDQPPTFPQTQTQNPLRPSRPRRSARTLPVALASNAKVPQAYPENDLHCFLPCAALLGPRPLQAEGRANDGARAAATAEAAAASEKSLTAKLAAVAEAKASADAEVKRVTAALGAQLEEVRGIFHEHDQESVHELVISCLLFYVAKRVFLMIENCIYSGFKWCGIFQILLVLCVLRHLAPPPLPFPLPHAHTMCAEKQMRAGLAEAEAARASGEAAAALAAQRASVELDVAKVQAVVLEERLVHQVTPWGQTSHRALGLSFFLFFFSLVFFRFFLRRRQRRRRRRRRPRSSRLSRSKRSSWTRRWSRGSSRPKTPRRSPLRARWRTGEGGCGAWCRAGSGGRRWPRPSRAGGGRPWPRRRTRRERGSGASWRAWRRGLARQRTCWPRRGRGARPRGTQAPPWSPL